MNGLSWSHPWDHVAPEHHQMEAFGLKRCKLWSQSIIITTITATTNKGLERKNCSPMTKLGCSKDASNL